MPHDNQFDFDVFISYSSKDKAWVRGELLKRIEAAGLKAFIDFRDFTRGAPSIKQMERGVVECRKTLLVLTPNYVNSEWAEIENIMAQTLSPANRDLRMIPLLKTECVKPPRIGALTHIDFTEGSDIDLAWRQLLTALGKPPEPELPSEPPRDEWFLAHPYPMPPNFTGRLDERAMLTRWLKEDSAHPLLVLRALGGFGKSALVWHWLTHDVSFADWPRVVWWSFYEGDTSFEHFLTETLNYLSGGKIHAKQISLKDATNTLLKMLHEPGTLLVLDGFERALRAFSGLDAAYQGDYEKSEVRGGGSGDSDRDCVSPLAETFLYQVALQPKLRSRVLLTTRLCPRILEARGAGLWAGCVEHELHQMESHDAVAFFRGRGIRGTDSEIKHECAAYGYHPLSLNLLAGWIVQDLQQRGDIGAARRLDVGGKDETGLARQRQRQHHVLEASYNSLSPSQQKLLSTIACLRNPVKYEVLRALAESEPIAKSKGRKRKESPPERLGLSDVNLDSDLRDLVARGLLHHDTKDGRFDLHPIVRRYAYDRLAERDRVTAHTLLRDYFAAVPESEKVTRLEDLAPVIELYHHTVRAGQFDEAFTLFHGRLHRSIYFQFGAYQLQIELLRALFPDGEDGPPRLKSENAMASTMNDLALVYSLTGQPRRAQPLFESLNAIYEKQVDNKRNLACGLGNLATEQLVVGTLRAAEDNLRRGIALCQEIKKEFEEAMGHQELGHLLAYRIAHAESKTELTTSVMLFKRLNLLFGKGLSCAYLAKRELLLMRSSSQLATADRYSAIPLARRALELADETARDSRFVYPIRDYVRAHWLLGAAYRVTGQDDEAELHLLEALERCRKINMVDHEADILIDLARLRAATGAPDESQRLAEEALLITERSGYVLQGADAHLELAKLALARGDRKLAEEHAEEATALATCDGPPDYTYKAAYDEAEALLKRLGAD
jgi:tetratricopeptide (TPR) repeat protein